MEVQAGSVRSAELRSGQDVVIEQLQAQLEERAAEIRSLHAKLDQYDQEIEKMVSKYSTSLVGQLTMLQTDIDKEQRQVKHLQDEAEKYAERVGRNEVRVRCGHCVVCTTYGCHGAGVCATSGVHGCVGW